MGHRVLLVTAASRAYVTIAPNYRIQRSGDRARRYFGAIRIAPSRRMTSPLSIGFSMI